MDPFTQGLLWLVFAMGGGLLGALAMEGFMRLVYAQIEESLDMSEALGALVTRKLEGARRVGTQLHLLSGVVFGLLYAIVLTLIPMSGFLWALLVCLALSLLHGLLFAYGLMFIASEHHPVEKYREATLQTGILHLFAHVVYGAVLGVVLGILSLFA